MFLVPQIGHYYKSGIALPETVNTTLVNQYFYVDQATKTLVGLTTEGMQQTSLDLSGLDITTIGKGAFINSKITSINVPEGVDKILEGAFYNCNNLVTVDLPTTIRHVKYCAFANGPSLSNCPTTQTFNLRRTNGFMKYNISGFLNFSKPGSVKNVIFNFNTDNKGWTTPGYIEHVSNRLVKDKNGAKTTYRFNFSDGYTIDGVFYPNR